MVSGDYSGGDEKIQTNETMHRRKTHHVRGGSWGSKLFKKMGNEVVTSQSYGMYGRGYGTSNKSGKKKGQSCGVKE